MKNGIRRSNVLFLFYLIWNCGVNWFPRKSPTLTELKTKGIFSYIGIFILKHVPVKANTGSGSKTVSQQVMERLPRTSQKTTKSSQLQEKLLSSCTSCWWLGFTWLPLSWTTGLLLYFPWTGQPASHPPSPALHSTWGRRQCWRPLFQLLALFSKSPCWDPTSWSCSLPTYRLYCILQASFCWRSEGGTLSDRGTEPPLQSPTTL